MARVTQRVITLISPRRQRPQESCANATYRSQQNSFGMICLAFCLAFNERDCYNKAKMRIPPQSSAIAL
jgi:hypothetical protein